MKNTMKADKPDFEKKKRRRKHFMRCQREAKNKIFRQKIVKFIEVLKIFNGK